MKLIPTAQERLKASFYNGIFIEINSGDFNLIKEIMIDFANLHVKAALEEALECVPYGSSDSISYDDVKGILTCYPPENIK